VNDEQGHVEGDRVLMKAAAILRDSVREIDVAARYGGEEFAVLLPGTTLEQAMLVAERVRAALASKPMSMGEHRSAPVAITLSLGVAQMRQEDTLATLAAAADGALYRAKSDGRNCVRAEYR